jgi:uncharacterized cupin superfamily protein
MADEKANIEEMEGQHRESPKGKYGMTRFQVSEALGAGTGTEPFEVEFVRLHPGKLNFPCHAHQVGWEYYIVLSGKGEVRREDRWFEVGAGDNFVQKPGTAHQIRNPSETEDLLYYVIADNPPAEIVHYPDSDKLGAGPPYMRFRATKVDDYYDGEE